MRRELPEATERALDRAVREVTAFKSWQELRDECEQGYTPTIRITEGDSERAVFAKQWLHANLRAHHLPVFDGSKVRNVADRKGQHMQSVMRPDNRNGVQPPVRLRGAARDVSDDSGLTR